MLYDFHTHTFLSDGVLSPAEQIRRAVANGYAGIGITDHVGVGTMATALAQASEDCALAKAHWGIDAVPGVELTHVPAASVAQLARRAKEMGAKLVVVHGETVVEPVERGTNLAALQSPDVDILAHPGLITPDELRLAATNGKFIEISARAGHSLTNGYIVQQGRAAGVKFLLNSDAHAPRDLLTAGFARLVALGAGLTEEEMHEVLELNPKLLLGRLRD